jgi:PAS domain S-box-containing protein
MTDTRKNEMQAHPAEIRSGDFHSVAGSGPTPLQQTNRELLLLQTFMEAMAHADSVEAALRVTLQCICETSGWRVGEIWRKSGDGLRLECEPVWYSLGEQADTFRQSRRALAFAPGVGLAGRAWVSKQPLWFPNAAFDSEIRKTDLSGHSGPVTAVGLPVLVDGQVEFVLEFFVFEIHPAYQGDLWLLSTMATTLGWIIQKFNTARALRESVERYQIALRGSHEGIWDFKISPEQPWDSPGKEIFYSPRCKELLGFQDHELENVMESWFSRIHQDDRVRVIEALRSHLERRIPYEEEFRILHKSGEYLWFSARGQAIWNDLGQPLRMAGTVRDVTEHRRAEEALRLRDRAIAASTCGITIADAQKPDRPIVYVNASFERIFGYPREEVLGRNPRFLQRHDREQPALGPLREAICEGKPHRTVLRNYHKDGRLIWNELVIAPVHDDQQRLTHFVGIQNDITEHIRSEEELQHRERLFRSLTENIHNLIAIVERQGILRYTSPSIERLIGYTPEEFLNRNLFDLIHPQDLSEVREAFAQIVKKPGEVGTKEFRLKDKSGEWHNLEVVGQNLLEDPAVSGIVLNARDITERKELERMVAQAEKMAAVGQLAAGIAHELNNPLHAILGFAHSLSEEVLHTGPFSEPLRLIEQEAARCQKLVQNLLTFSRQRKNGMVPESPVELWEGILPLIETQAKVNNVIVMKDFQLDLPLIKVDRSQIHQVLLNLCSNALDAMPTGGRLMIGAALKSRPLDGSPCIVFSVADTGTGIEPNIQERIFEPFFTTKRVGAGTGLGLSLAYEIAQRHHGQITVTSELGKGSLFEMYIPLTKATLDGAPGSSYP